MNKTLRQSLVTCLLLAMSGSAAFSQDRKPVEGFEGRVEDVDPEDDDEGIINGVIGGFVEIVAEGINDAFGRPNRKVDDAVLNQDLDKIETDRELDALEAKLKKDPQVQGMLPQFQKQYEHLCSEELRFVHLVSPLRQSEFKAIEKVARRASKVAMLKTCQVQARMQNGRLRGVNAPKFPNANKILEDALLSVVDRELSKSKSTAYRTEIDTRRAFRREGTTETIVSALDTLLMLSPQQRESILAVLQTGWKDEWQRHLQMLQNGIEYMPNLPKQEIRKLLTKKQGGVFDSVRWQNNTFFGFNAMGMFGFARNQQAAKLDQELDFLPEADGGVE